MTWTKRFRNTAYVLARSRIERTVPFWPIEWIDRLQRSRVRKIVQHAYETVPFYRQAMDERDLHPSDFGTVKDIAGLPIIDGMTVQRNIEAFLSTRYGDESRRAFYSAGSTSGIRRTVYWDNRSLLGLPAYHQRSRVVLRNLVGQRGPLRQIHIAPSGSAGNVMQPFFEASTLTPRGPTGHHVLSTAEPFEIVAERINSIQPHVVYSYSSYAEQFFRFLAERQMSIALPRVWIYGAEMLSPSGRELIEKTFGCPTYSTYQATEAWRIGFQCERRQGFHLNVDLFAVRLVDEGGRTVEPGEMGEVVISNLCNRAMVLLNYRLDDWGVMAPEPCPCGRSLPLLERLEGRSSEMLQLADGRTISSLRLNAACDVELRPALQIQIVHPAPGHVRWRIVPSSGADRDTLRRDLLQRCRSVLGGDAKVEVEFVDEIPSTPQGKFVRVVSGPEPTDTPDLMTLGG